MSSAKKYSLTFKGEVEKSVDFLDVNVKLNDTSLTSTLYIKLSVTDSSSYLHRRSDHSPHTFNEILFSQYRRAVAICSNENERIGHINHTEKKFVYSGYKKHELESAKNKALQISRKKNLQRKHIENVKEENTLIFLN